MAESGADRPPLHEHHDDFRGNRMAKGHSSFPPSTKPGHGSGRGVLVPGHSDTSWPTPRTPGTVWTAAPSQARACLLHRQHCSPRHGKAPSDIKAGNLA